MSDTQATSIPLKYGINSHQVATMYIPDSKNPHLEIINGKPGYINILDAINSWCLVSEVDAIIGQPCAASFKHVSPAGVAISGELSLTETQLFSDGKADTELSPICTAYIRARNCDPQASFGDFVAVNEPVDITLANVLKGVISDGIIAPEYTPEALQVLKEKKKGDFIILRALRAYDLDWRERRTLWGIGLEQTPNHAPIKITPEMQVTEGNSTTIPPGIITDLTLASIVAKYTQSNTIVFAMSGRCIGIGAGQQSRIRCTKLAAEKAIFFIAREYPAFLNVVLAEPKLKRQEKVNLIEELVGFIMRDDLLTSIDNKISRFAANLNTTEFALFETMMGTNGSQLYAIRKQIEEFVREKIRETPLCVSSDGFFPNVDNIEYLDGIGVKYIVQPGGSIADNSITVFCNAHGITMFNTGLRLFHH